MFTSENQYQQIKEFPEDSIDPYNSSCHQNIEDCTSFIGDSKNYDILIKEKQDEDYIKRKINEEFFPISDEDGNQINLEIVFPSEKKDLSTNINQIYQKGKIQKEDLSTKEKSDSNHQKKNEYSKEGIKLIKPILNKKRERTNDSGDRKNTMLNVYKSNFVSKIVQYSDILLENTEYYKQNKNNFKKIDKQLYIEQSAEKNLDFLDMKIEDLLSVNKENLEIINIIKKTKDYRPLIEFLGFTIKELTMFYTSNDSFQQKNLKDYQIFLLNSYSDLVYELETKRKKTKEYMDKFKQFTKNVSETFSDMKLRSNNRKKKK